MAALRSIGDLADAIAKDTATLHGYCQKNHLQSPSFNESGPSNVNIPPGVTDVAAAHARALSATRELHQLLQGPTMALRTVFQINDLFALQFISHFNVASHVPPGGDISFEDLATLIGIDKQPLMRVLRYGFTNWLFTETRPGFVGHTAATRAMHDNQGTRDAVGFGTREGLRSSFSVIDALEKYGASQEPIESVRAYPCACSAGPSNVTDNENQGWGLANHATQPFYTELALRHPKRSAVVARALESYSSGAPLDPLLDAYDFSLGNQTTKVVDVGGGHGQVSMAIAKRHTSIYCVVQDLPEAIKAATAKRDQLPEDSKHRVQYEVHDFFEEQPIRDAQVYLFRAIFHNWPDKYCIKALKALIPALREGARVVVVDSVMPEPGVAPAPLERLKRATDLNMMTFFNARERTEEDWKDLFGLADPRFKFQGVMPVGKGPQTVMLPYVMELIWEP